MAAFADRVDHGARRADRLRSTHACRPHVSTPTMPASAAAAGADDAEVPTIGGGVVVRTDGARRGRRALARNKLRSALTMLGVFIGVAALIAMVAVGQGANAAVEAADREPGHEPARRPARRDHQRAACARGFGSASTLTVTDARSDPEGGSRGRRRRLSRPAARADRVRQPELEHQHPGRHAELPRDPELAASSRADRCRKRTSGTRPGSACSDRPC